MRAAGDTTNGSAAPADASPPVLHRQIDLYRVTRLANRSAEPLSQNGPGGGSSDTADTV